MMQSGVTADGRPVFAGVFSCVGTYGLPLELILSVFQERGFSIDWPDYIAGAMQDGARERTIKSRISSAVGDVFGPHYRAQVEKRLDIYFLALTASKVREGK